MPNLLPLEAALARVAAVEPVCRQTESVPVERALGRVLAAAVTAPRDIPRFDNSAVDGFAIGSDAKEGSRFEVVGTASAGTPFAGGLDTGKAVRIATGAELPRGTVTVVMQEDCTPSGDTVTVGTVSQAGAHCRRAGQDVTAGATVLSPDRRLSAPDLSMLTALGLAHSTVRRTLRVGLASTGSELIEPGCELQAGQIHDSNRPLLKALLQFYPVEIVDLGVLVDDADTTRTSLLETAGRVDVIVTTGGV